MNPPTTRLLISEQVEGYVTENDGKTKADLKLTGYWDEHLKVERKDGSSDILWKANRLPTENNWSDISHFRTNSSHASK